MHRLGDYSDTCIASCLVINYVYNCYGDTLRLKKKKTLSNTFLIPCFHFLFTFRVCQDGRKPHTIRLIIRRYSPENHCSRESRQCPIPSHVIQKLGTGLGYFSNNLIGRLNS